MTDPQRDPLDSWLDSAQSVEPSAQLRRVVAEIPLRHPRAERLHALWPFGSLWKALSLALVVCTLGAVAGATSVEATDSDDDNLLIATEYADLAFASSLDEEFEP